jgi:hypothetical protein
VRTYADAINAALAERPAGMTVTMHTCRGNFKSTWVAAGGYEPVVEAMFSAQVDGFFMEFDSERAGDFAPLRFAPKGKKVVLGLVTTKVGELEDKDTLRRRIDAARAYVPLENLCLSPQCGFSSTHHGNLLSYDEQWRKLERIVEVARDVWGSYSITRSARTMSVCGSCSPKRLCRLQIDRQVVLIGSSPRRSRASCAFQDLVDVGRRAPYMSQTGPVGHQPPASTKPSTHTSREVGDARQFAISFRLSMLTG